MLALMSVLAKEVCVSKSWSTDKVLCLFFFLTCFGVASWNILDVGKVDDIVALHLDAGIVGAGDLAADLGLPVVAVDSGSELDHVLDAVQVLLRGRGLLPHHKPLLLCAEGLGRGRRGQQAPGERQGGEDGADE